MAARPAGSSQDEPASACHRRGLELLREGDAAAALPELERAVMLDPDNPEFLKDRGNAQKALGELEAAVGSYRRSIAAAPDYIQARYNLGLTLRELERPEEAESQFRRIHELDSRDVDALFNLADLLASRSRFSESMTLYRAALALAPDNPYLWLELGNVCAQLPGQMEESAACLGKCIKLRPDLADAHHRLGTACKALGRIGDALECYRKALALEPGSPEVYNDLGNVFLDEGRLDEAAPLYRKAIELSPGYAPAHVNLGNVLARQGSTDEAIGRYLRAVELDPELASAHLNLGSLHSLRGDWEQAIRCYETVARLQPGNTAATGCLLFEMQRACDWSRFDELCAAQRRGAVEQPEHDTNPFHLFSIPSTPQQQLQCARNYAAHRVRAVARDRERLGFRFAREPRSRLRIGYLSADFREHPGAHLIAELIELHDRARFEIAAYSYGPDDRSPIRMRLARAFDRFVDLAPLPHAEAAGRIHGDEVDILVDLTGYTTHARTEILALRPAPIQVSYLGYPGTLGADFIDYLISDRFITPPGSSDGYSEQLVRMPGSYQVNDRKRSVAETPPRSELGLPDGAFVFCCFNQTSKILPHVFAAWMRLLNAVPGAVLWLVEAHPRAVENLRREAHRHGVAAERLLFAPRVPLSRYLARMRAADLFLDTHPYTAHTTASDALWVGLPVLTCAGDTFASRVAGSLLTAVGLPELITTTLEEYEALALRLARDPASVTALREKLARNRSTAPLFDTPAFARKLEDAYSRMWAIHLAGERPRAIDP